MRNCAPDVTVFSMSVRHLHLQLCRKDEPRILPLTQRACYNVGRTPHTLLQQPATIVFHDDRFVQIGHLIVQTQSEGRIITALHYDATRSGTALRLYFAIHAMAAVSTRSIQWPFPLMM